MLNIFVENLIFTKAPLFGLLCCLVAISFNWQSISMFLKLVKYSNVQRVHNGEVSRLGGLLIYFYLFCIYFLNYINQQFIFNILISALPFVFVSVKEDLFYNTTPKIRLISMIISCLIFFYINPLEFPVINIPYLNDLLNFYPIQIIFFTFSIIIVMNGMNLIDGMNGLLTFTSIFQLMALILLASLNNDYELIFLLIIFIIPMILFLFFNFPFAKVFIGDTGAYFIGFVNSILVIYLFGKNENISSWLAVLILFYPSFELFFSFIRKVLSDLSPFKPDLFHLHSIIYKLFLQNKYKYANALTTLSLFMFYVTPLAFIYYLNLYQNSLSILYIIFLLLILYLFIYYFTNKKLKFNN